MKERALRDLSRVKKFLGNVVSEKVVVIPVAVVASLGFFEARDLNSYTQRENDYIRRWADYDLGEVVVDKSEVDEPISVENAHRFLSIDESLVPKGYVTTEVSRDNLYFATRTAHDRIYGINLVFDNLGQRLVVDNQRGMLNLMRFQKDFEDGDMRLLAFSMIVASEGGFEGLREWDNSEAQVVVNPENNTATVSFWKVYVEDSYPTRTNLLSEEDRELISSYYGQVEGPQHGMVYKIVSTIDLSYVQSEDGPLTELTSEFVGVDWNVWNR